MRLRLLVMQEKQDYLEVVREVWAMQLDATRNRIIRIDLVVAIASFAMILPTVPAAFFVRPSFHPTCNICAQPLLCCDSRAWKNTWRLGACRRGAELLPRPKL